VIFNVWNYTIEDPNQEITARCPGCGHMGTFDELAGVPDVVLPRQLRWPRVYLGQRRCPNKKCNTHIFFALQRDSLLAVYPAQRTQFDKTGIPPSVASSLEEAITCYDHACYRAAAMLVRRSLEELCHEQGVTGTNLKARLDILGTASSVPPVMLQALHDLRLLGNDAVHFESTDYLDVGKEEAELAITVVKHVLQVVYQDPILVDKLKARKR
jgi:hypothetical protein